MPERRTVKPASTKIEPAPVKGVDGPDVVQSFGDGEGDFMQPGDIEAYRSLIKNMEAPNYTFKMTDSQVTEGNLARFDCRVVAYPLPDIFWMKDDKLLEPSQHFQFLNFNDEIYSLFIQNVTLADSGHYTCLARNSYGEAMTVAYLNVISLKEMEEEKGDFAPKFRTKFYDVEVMEGIQMDLSASIAGCPEPEVKWLYNGKTLRASERVSISYVNKQCILEFKEVKLEDAGKYSCVISNKLGEATCTAKLLVREDVSKRRTPEMAPKIVTPLEELTVKEGQKAKFDITIKGHPQADLTWYCNGKRLLQSDKIRLQEDGDNFSLIMSDVRMEDAGQIKCRAMNVAGEVFSVATLDVRESRKREKSPKKKMQEEMDTKYGYAPTFTKKPQPIGTMPGKSAKFDVRVLGMPDPEVKWFKGDREITEDSKYSIYTDRGSSELHIKDVGKTDTGDYTCTIKNQLGTTTAYSKLSLEDEKPSGYTPKYDQVYARGSPARYDTGYDHYDGVSPAKRPYSSDVPIKKVPTLLPEKPYVSDVQPESARLSWQPAKTHGLPVDASLCTYTVESRELPAGDWNSMSSGIYGNTYIARSLKPDREYAFRVKAENVYGTSDPTAPVSIPERPADRDLGYGDKMAPRAPPVLPKHKPFVTDYGEDTVRLTWKPVDLGSLPSALRARRPPPVSYQLELKEMPTHKDYNTVINNIPTNSYLLSDLLPDHDYMVRVRAENDYGLSDPTESLWLPRAKAFPGVPIERPEIDEMDQRSLGLRWRRVDIPSHIPNDEPLMYMIDMQSEPDKWTTVASDITDTRHTLTGLTPHKDYNFRVRGKTSTGTVTDPSPVASVYRTLAQSTVPVDEFKITDYHPDFGSAKLRWQKMDMAPYTDDDDVTFMVEESYAPYKDWKPLASGIPTTDYHIRNLQPKRDSQYRVRALSQYGLSPPTHPVSLFQDTPIVPVRPSILDMEPEAVRLAWQPPSILDYRPTEYDIEVREYPRMDWRPVARGIKDTSYRVSGLMPTRDYEFRVKAAIPPAVVTPSSASTSPLYQSLPPVSLVQSTTPVKPRLPIKEPMIYESGSDSVRLSWEPADTPVYQRTRMPVYYTVEQLTIPGRDWVPIARRLTDTSHTVHGLKPDLDYRFRITAENEYGISPPTNPAMLHRKPQPIFSLREPTIAQFNRDFIRLKWDPVTMPSGKTYDYPVAYDVEIQDFPGGMWRTVGRNVPNNYYDLVGLNPAHDYLSRVTAVYNGNRSEPSRSLHIARLAGPPRIPRDIPYAFEVMPDSLTLSWRAAELPENINDFSPITYRVEACETPGSEWMLIATGIPNTGFRILGLYPEKGYSFRVRAENEYGVSEPTRPVVINPRTVAPQMPTDTPFLSDVSSTHARLSWRAADVPTYSSDLAPITYNIHKQESAGGAWQPLVRRIPHTSYLIHGLDSKKDYWFRVEAENSHGVSTPTMPVRLPRTFDDTPIDYPSILGYEESSLKLGWQRRSMSLDKTPLSYRVEMRSYDEDDWKPLATGIKDTHYRISKLPPKKDYFFRIRGELPTGLTEPAPPISFFRDQYVPHVPIERPQIYELAEDSVRLSWHLLNIPIESKRPIYYNIEMREVPGSEWRTIASRVTDTSHRLTGLRSDVDYQFRVRAGYSDGLSEPSYHTTLFRKIVRPKLHFDRPEIEYDDTPSSVKLKWQLVDVPAHERDDEPLSYIIEQQDLPSYEWKPIARRVRDSSYRVSGLSSDRDYRFRVRAEYPSVGDYTPGRYIATEPSVDIPLYRKPVYPDIPIARPEFIEDDYSRPSLKWYPVHIPGFTKHDDISYHIEKQDAKSREWKTYARDIRSYSYELPDLPDKEDLMFRIRAVTSSGRESTPTPPIPRFRSRVPYIREPIRLKPMKPITFDFTGTSHPYIEFLTTRVPPRLPIEKPDLFINSRSSVDITWKKARVPQSIQHLPVTYSVEIRVPPSYSWQEVQSGLTSLTHKCDGLNMKKDYVFRVRAWNEYGSSEPTLPAFLHRPYEQPEDIQFEEVQQPSLDKIPPKLPMDTPKIVAISDEAITLSWLPARIPAYAIKTPISYVIEAREPPNNWKRYKDNLIDTKHTIRGLKTEQDYHFRVRAESQFGMSEATLPATLQRTKSSFDKRTSVIHDRRSSLVMERRSSIVEELKKASIERRGSLGGDDSYIPPAYVETIASEGPPRVPSGRPKVSGDNGDNLMLSWTPARTPAYMKHTTIHYTIEARQPPTQTWRVVAERVVDTSYRMSDLKSERDYMFRVRAVNEHGASEPTLPTSLFRDKGRP